MTAPEAINGYHAHIYYPDSDARARAADIRAYIEDHYDVAMGRWRDEPVGPHPLPMYQVAFSNVLFPILVPWLMLNRQGLSILVHPNTEDPVQDHRDFPLWLGEKLDLNIEFLEVIKDNT